MFYSSIIRKNNDFGIKKDSDKMDKQKKENDNIFLTKLINKNKTRDFSVEGFMVIELLVVVAIIFILLAIVVLNYKSSNAELALQRATYKLAADIRLVQSKAGLKGSGCSNSDYKGGYGINFKKNEEKYTLFADCNNNKLFDETNNEPKEELEFEKGVIVSNLSPSDNDQLTIVFVPPDPLVFINAEKDNLLATITLSLSDNLIKIRVLKINKAGMVEID
jgi:type II secretory pathway pseudopilin PulG